MAKGTPKGLLSRIQPSEAMASNRIAMASTLVAMASNLIASNFQPNNWVFVLFLPLKGGCLTIGRCGYDKSTKCTCVKLQRIKAD